MIARGQTITIDGQAHVVRDLSPWLVWVQPVDAPPATDRASCTNYRRETVEAILQTETAVTHG
jgi:hypothetical protein